MGCFGYICKGCGTPINGDCFSGGEKCVLIHVRHGKEIGRAEGRYNEYGGIIEQENSQGSERYRGESGPNSHNEICNSEFSMDDSYYRLTGIRKYKNAEVTYHEFVVAIRKELSAVHGREKAGKICDKMESDGELELQYAALPVPTRESYSGTAAWHSRCYNQASLEARNNLTPSLGDPGQSWGTVRKEYK